MTVEQLDNGKEKVKRQEHEQIPGVSIGEDEPLNADQEVFEAVAEAAAPYTILVC